LADGLKRGQFVVVAMQGDYGKPRPALVVQSDNFSELSSIVVCPTTTAVQDNAFLFRVTVAPSADNGLRQLSQVAVDKISSISRSKVGQVIGTADEALMLKVEQALLLFFELRIGA